jgi:Xaa-Pro aminopeptidase
MNNENLQTGFSLHSDIARSLAAYDQDAVLLTSRENNRYFSGFSGTESFLVLTGGQAALFVDFRYLEQATAECPGCTIIDYTTDRMGALLEYLQTMRVRRLGVEEEQLSWKMGGDLAAALGDVQLCPAEYWIFLMRSVKNAEEIARIEHAIAIAEQAFVEILPTIRPGQAETEVAARLEHAMRLRGASGPSFATIVGSGPRSAMPHGVASERRILANEPVVIDFGCFWQGYCSDMTRTVFVGEPSGLFVKIYDLVLAAQLAGTAAVRAGETGQAVDQVARDIIGQAGYGSAFGHGLGHGVGLAIHEMPRLSRSYTAPLRTDEIVSVEPGIYLPGEFGVRIEDLVLVEPEGCRNLNKLGKELVILPAG